MLKGCISASIDEKEFLESLSVIVGIYSETEKEFRDCLVSDEAMENLDRYWGEFLWSLFSIDKGIHSLINTREVR